MNNPTPHTATHDTTPNVPASAAPLMIGVSGMRGIVGASLTPVNVSRYVATYGTWLASQQTNGQPPHVLIGRDSRRSGQMYEQAASAALLAVGCRVTTVGIVTTPGVAVMIEHLQADGGIVLTASHNPIIWNGVKFLGRDGSAPPADQAQAIIDAYRAKAIAYVDVHHVQPMVHDNTAAQVHVDAVLKHIDVEVVRSASLSVVLDSVHGAGGLEGRLLLDRLGCEVTHLYAEPTGDFPRPPEPVREQLGELCQAVVDHGAAIGFAQDPDADRLAIVDESGRYIGEEYTLALCARHVLATRAVGEGKSESVKPQTATENTKTTEATTEGKSVGPVMVANLSTSRMLNDIAATYGATVARTPVGEANVAHAIQTHGAIVGGEGNGGIIWPCVVHVRDSLVGMALMLEMLATQKQALSAIVEDSPAYAIVKEKVELNAANRDIPGQLAEVLPPKFTEQAIDLQDGVRIDWPDRWVHVRASNTEPILRLIAEGPTEDDCRVMIDQVRAALNL